MPDAQGNSQEINDAQRLKYAREGVPFTLPDGQEIHFRYTVQSLLLIEEHFGSLAEMQAKVNVPNPKVADLFAFIHAGIFDADYSMREMAKVLPLEQLQEAFDAASRALTIAMPAPSPNGNASARKLTGAGSTTSRRSGLAAIAKSSST